MSKSFLAFSPCLVSLGVKFCYQIHKICTFMTLFLHVTRLYLTKFLAVCCLVKDLCTQKQYFTQK